MSTLGIKKKANGKIEVNMKPHVTGKQFYAESKYFLFIHVSLCQGKIANVNKLGIN